MSKKVASEYLRRVSSSGRTITVYFSDSQRMDDFLDRVSSTYEDDVSMNLGFDYVTFLSTDSSVIDQIEKKASQAGLTVSGL